MSRELPDCRTALKVNLDLSTGVMEWSIPFQTRHGDAEHSIGQHMKKGKIGARKTYFWFSIKNLISPGVEGIMKKPRRPMRTENNPCYRSGRNTSKNTPKHTRTKIQAHPGQPPRPFMFSIAAASIPEKSAWQLRVNVSRKSAVDDIWLEIS